MIEQRQINIALQKGSGNFLKLIASLLLGDQERQKREHIHQLKVMKK